MLSEFVKKEYIQLNISADKWVDAITKAAQPLLEDGAFTQEYVDDIIEGVLTVGPYIVIAKHVALPHARKERGALKPALGITTLKTPVKFGSPNDPVKYLFTLSATDNTSHIEALANLADLLEDGSFYDILDQATSAEELLKQLKEKETKL